MRKSPGKITGLAIKQIFKRPATIKYPKGKLEIDKNYRGKLIYNSADCIGCNLCVRDCPANAIKVSNIGTKEDKKFEMELDIAHCIFCGQCVESCPKGCLALTNNIELAKLDKKDLRVKM